MEAILRRIEVKEYKNKEGRPFKKFNFECDVVNSDDSVKTLRGSYSEEYARKYFNYCNVKTKDLLGKKVSCIVGKRRYETEEGETKFAQYIKFMNVLDKDGNAIIMPKSGNEIDF